jgi:hypothetical protein
MARLEGREAEELTGTSESRSYPELLGQLLTIR